MTDQPTPATRIPAESHRREGTAGPRTGQPPIPRPRTGGQGVRAVDRALLEMSWPLPTTRDLALDAVRSLERIRAELLAQQGPDLTKAGVRDGIDALLGRSGFILTHWTGELAALAPEEWSPAHTDALTLDLAEIARTGAQIRDLIAATPPSAASVAGTARASAPVGHRRTRTPPPVRQPTPDTVHVSGSVLDTFSRLPPTSRRLLLQASAITCAGLAVAAVCYLAWDRHHPAAPTAKGPAVRGTSRPAAAGSAAPALPAASTSSPVATPAADPVTSLQIQLLGASSTRQSVEAIVYLDTASPVPVEVDIAYHGTADPRPVTGSEQLAGHTSYQFALSIDAAPYCGSGVVVSASSDGFSASQTTSAGPCPTTSPGSTTESPT